MIEWWQTLAQLYPAPVKTYSMPRMATRCVPRSLCYQNEASGEEIKVPQVGVSCRRAWAQVGDFILCMVINYFTLQWKKFICTYGRSHSILLILPSAACQTWPLLNNQPIKWSLALSIYLGPSSKVHNQCTKLRRTSPVWWKSNTINNYKDMTYSSLHIRSSKYIICLIHTKSWVHSG
jgi:hypothetical protein